MPQHRIGNKRQGALYTSAILPADRQCTMDQCPPRYPVTCAIDGKKYKGTY